MIRLLVLLVLALAGIEVHAAAPVLSCTLSRSSGTAPLGIVIDCSGSTDADTAKPFHDLFYTHTFGDPSAGLWTYGANTALSKNYATGAIAAHIYETSGTYTITTTVTDGTNIARTTNTITVTAADTTYSGTNTTCFFNSTVGSGCPAGATQTSSSNYATALAACLGASNRRCLFKRGDTFSASTDTTYNTAGPTHVGAYGSGAKPIINVSGANVHAMEVAGTTFSDFRFVDLDIRGDGIAHTQSALLSNFAISNVTLLRVDVSATGQEAVSIPGGCTGCVFQDSTFQTNVGGATFYGDIITSGFLGNQVGPTSTGAQHALRVALAQKSVISSNTVTTSQANKEVFALRANTHTTTADDSFYVVVSDNKIIEGSLAANSFQISNGGSTDVRVYDVVFERNWILGTTFGGSGFDCRYALSNGTRITFRNNLFDMRQCGDASYGVYVWNEGGGSQPTPTDNDIYNNTMYSAGTTSQFVGVFLGSGTSSAIVKNTICYFTSGGAGTTCISDSSTGATKTNNTSTVTTDPLFDDTTSPPIGFRIGTGSYAATGGTAIFPPSNDDFYHCDDTTANERQGAFVSRTRATCRGAAGP